MEYYKNLSLEDLFYINNDGLVCCEQWKGVFGYECLYMVSDLGRVKSLDYRHTKKENVLKQGTNCGFYMVVAIYKKGIRRTRLVHQLVAEAFLNHVPNGHTLVPNHKNKIKHDNRLENLEIITQRENCYFKHNGSSSKYIGVCNGSGVKKWVAQIWINEKLNYLGCFDNEEEASEYYQDALKLHLNGEEIILKKRVNTSSYKGVSWDKFSNKWKAQIQTNRKKKFLGLFENEIEASNVYQIALLKKNIKIFNYESNWGKRNS